MINSMAINLRITNENSMAINLRITNDKLNGN